MPSDLKEKTVELLKLRPNKKLLQQDLQIESGKVVYMRDIHNLAQKAKAKGSESRNDLAEVVNILIEEYGK